MTTHPLSPLTALLAPQLDHVCTCMTCRRTWTPSRYDGESVSTGLDVTRGPWATEDESTTALDEVLGRLRLFRVFEQVNGQYIQPRSNTPTTSPRIDRVLWPGNRLLQQGWNLGPIGIECKSSDHKIGRPVAQILDYSRALWHLGQGITVSLSWVFLWPFSHSSGPLASVMAQNRIGGAVSYGPEQLLLYFDSGTVTKLTTSDLRLADVRCGNKVGSR